MFFYEGKKTSLKLKLFLNKVETWDFESWDKADGWTGGPSYTVMQSWMGHCPFPF